MCFFYLKSGIIIRHGRMATDIAKRIMTEVILLDAAKSDLEVKVCAPRAGAPIDVVASFKNDATFRKCFVRFSDETVHKICADGSERDNKKVADIAMKLILSHLIMVAPECKSFPVWINGTPVLPICIHPDGPLSTVCYDSTCSVIRDCASLIPML